jgi:hypothetical protein
VSVRLVALVVAVVAIVILAAGCGGDSAPEDLWSGSWRELDSPQRYVLTLSPSDRGGYSVTYPRSFKVPFHGELKDDVLEIYGENAWDVVWSLTCDGDVHRLTAKGRQGTFHLERVQE